MVTKRLSVFLLIFLTAIGMYGNYGEINFEGRNMPKPSAEVIQEINGESFAFVFTTKGDGGQFYMSPTAGKNHSRGLVATSLSVGASEAEEIIIRKTDFSEFVFSGIFIKPGGEAVVITPLYKGEAVDEPFTINGMAGGKELFFNNLKVDAVSISSRDMVQLGIDNFVSSSVVKIDPDLNREKKDTVLSFKKLDVVETVGVLENPTKDQELSRINLAKFAEEFNVDINDVVIDINKGNDPGLNGKRPFYLSTDYSALKVNDPLQFDCEKLNDFNIEFKASDYRGNHVRVFSIKVALLEANDEYPTIAFNQSCNISSKSNLNGSIDLCAIVVDDKDSEISSLHNWLIEKSELPKELLSINSNGVITISNVNALLKEGAKSYKVWVSVFDGVNRSEAIPVLVNVESRVEKIKHWPEERPINPKKEKSVEVLSESDGESAPIFMEKIAMKKTGAVLETDLKPEISIKKSPDLKPAATAENAISVKGEQTNITAQDIMWLSQIIK